MFGETRKGRALDKVRRDKVQYGQGRRMAQASANVCLLCLSLSQNLDFWLHLTSVAVSCCFAVNLLAVPCNLSL